MSGDSEIRRILAEQYHRDVMDDPEHGTPPVKQIGAIENELMNGPASVKTANGGTFIKRMAM